MNNITEIVSALNGKAMGDNSWICHCPSHEDKTPSLSVSLKDGKILFHCHAGCSQETVMEALRQKGLWENKQITARKKIVALYDYINKENKLVYQVCRFEPKDFRQRRPGSNGKWIWNLRNTSRILYHLPEIMNADQVFICEGEKDADALKEIGLVATTNCGGASNWMPEYSETLRDKDCVILPDNDQPGRGHAVTIAESLKDMAMSVKILNLPDLPKKGDVSDWINMGNSHGDLIALALNAEPYESGIEFAELEREISPTVSDCKQSKAATKLATQYFNKNYTQEDTLILIGRWNSELNLPLSDTVIDRIVGSIFSKYQKDKLATLAGSIKKIVIKRYPDGTTNYDLHLGDGIVTTVSVDDLLSGRRTCSKITESINIVFDPPKQQRWLDLVRIWLDAAETKLIAIDETELGIIQEVLRDWIGQWDKQKDSAHLSLSSMLKNSCVIEDDTIYFTLPHMDEELRFRNLKFTRTLLCEFLRKLGAKVTEPRRRFESSRIRSWEIERSNCD